MLTADDQAITDKNKKGFGDLVLSIDCTKPQGIIAFAIVKNAKTKEMLGGDLMLTFKRLKIKYKPNTVSQVLKLTKEFHFKQLIKNKDPEIFVMELEALQVKLEDLSHLITDKTIVLEILNNLNEQYDMETKLLEHCIYLYKEEVKGKELSIKEVRTELNLRYESFCNNTRQASNTVKHAYYMGTRFKGKCHWCGKIGHKSAECRQKLADKPKTIAENEQYNKIKKENKTANISSQTERMLHAHIVTRRDMKNMSVNSRKKQLTL
jgi:hypothetical protein